MFRRPGMMTSIAGMVLAVVATIGFALTDAPGWARWVVAVGWGFYLMREGTGTYQADFLLKRIQALESADPGRRF